MLGAPFAFELAAHTFYTVSHHAHQEVSNFGFDDDDTLVVFEGVRHVLGGFFVIGEPVPLEDFGCMCRKASTKEATDRTSKKAAPMAADVLQRLLEEYPWLRENDVQRVLAMHGARGVAREKAATHVQMKLSEEDILEEAAQTVQEESAAKRSMLHFDEIMEDHFYVFLSGGQWTKKFKGCAADTAQFKARSGAKDFCESRSEPIGS